MIKESIPCRTCSESTHNTGTRQCNRCWEVESRLEDYIARGGYAAVRFIHSVLERRGPCECINLGPVPRCKKCSPG